MKDNKKYLYLECITGYIYVLFNYIYLFCKGFSEKNIASLFFVTLSLALIIILTIQIKKNKVSDTSTFLISLWLFIVAIIPGVFGFVFLNSKKEKKDVNLPATTRKKSTCKDIIKSVITLTLFLLIMFVFPHFKFYYKIPSILIYIFIVSIILIFYFKDLKRDFLTYKSNFKTYFKFAFKRYFIMLGIMFLVAIPIVMLNKGNTSNNQEMINDMFKKVPIITFVLSVIYAPFAEESIFRLSLSKLINNKTLFIIISGILFGSLHVIGKAVNFEQALYVIQYSTLGMCLAKAYSDTDNIFVSIQMHFTQNFLAALLALLLF